MTIIYLDPCPKCGNPLSVDNRKRYIYCKNSHYSKRLYGVTQHTKFVARSLTAEEAENKTRDTASWTRLKKT